LLIVALVTPANAQAPAPAPPSAPAPDEEPEEAEPAEEPEEEPAEEPAPPPAPPPTPPAPAPGAYAPWWQTYRPYESGSSSLRAPLAATGGGLMGVGVITLLVSGVSWLVAWGHSTELEDECPNHRCVEGTRGGDALQSARSASRTADIAAAVGIPVFTVGAALLVLGLASGSDVAMSAPTRRVVIKASPGGAGLEVKF
jgi:hypothetical protein